MTLHAMIICKGCVIQWVQVYSVIGCDPMGCLLSVFCCIVCDIGIVTSMKVNHKPADFARNDARRYTCWATF